MEYKLRVERGLQMSSQQVGDCMSLGKALPLVAALAVGLTGCGGGTTTGLSDPPADPPALSASGDPPGPPAVMSFSDPPDPPAVTANTGDPPSPVPEPSTAWLFLSGAGALAVFRHSIVRRRSPEQRHRR